MSCVNCITAAKRPWHGYTSSCNDCQARDIARRQPYWDSIKAKARTPAYEEQMQRMFGDAWEDWHQRVWHWWKADRRRVVVGEIA